MKNIYKSCLLAAIFLFAVNACTLFKKGISKPVTVSLSDSTFLAEKNAKANYIKYLDLQSSEKLTNAFLKGFKSEAAITKNVTLKFNDDNADFILKVKNSNKEQIQIAYKNKNKLWFPLVYDENSTKLKLKTK